MVERTESDEVSAAFSQRNVVAYDFLNLCRGINAFYGLAGNQKDSKI